jgi:hypothetical protein
MPCGGRNLATALFFNKAALGSAMDLYSHFMEKVGL